jgi:hypothetical protein
MRRQSQTEPGPEEPEIEEATQPQASKPEFATTKKAVANAGRIMYIEFKGDGIAGPGRIGRVTFSKTGRTLYYGGKRFAPIADYKANYCDIDTGERYWISGPKHDGTDRLWGGIPTEIDDDVREEYWREIRGMPERANSPAAPGKPKYRRGD